MLSHSMMIIQKYREVSVFFDKQMIDKYIKDIYFLRKNCIIALLVYSRYLSN